MNGLEALNKISAWATSQRRRSRKASGTTTSLNYSTDSVVNGKRFRALMDDTIVRSKWLRYGMHMIAVDPGTTVIPIDNWEDLFWEHVPASQETDSTGGSPVRPSHREVQIAVEHFRFQMSLGKYAKRSANSLLPNTDIQRSYEQGFSKALGNNLARTAVLANPASSARGLQGISGLALRAQQEAVNYSFAQNVGGVLVAQAFDPNVMFHAAFENLDEGLRADRLRWYGLDRLWTQYDQWVGNGGTAERMRDDDARRAFFEGQVRSPLGRMGLSVPQWPGDEGPSADSTAVVNNGSTLTVRVAGVLPDANSYAGRRVRLTLKSTGVSQECTVDRDSGQNKITTTNLLGQVSVSTTAADYTVKVCDESSLLLADPFGILLCMNNQVEVYRKFDEVGLKHDTIAHAWVDVRLLRSEAISRVSGFYLPRRV